MSNVPPAPEMTAYPRGSLVDKQKLRTLVEGYFGMSVAFGLTVLCNFIGTGLMMFVAMQMNQPVIIYLGIVFGVAGAFFFTLGPNEKIGIGLGWKENGKYIASGLIALNVALFCGVVGFIVVQQMATNAMKRDGLRLGFFVSKKKLLGQIDAL